MVTSRCVPWESVLIDLRGFNAASCLQLEFDQQQKNKKE
uniref:Uncharacterized protein n=1 Tax=Magnetococcus massalia (strain MO-1) TaxID=451514 RepID=A0A1S7LM29_MAGMO|nr:Protein of unknown function [Candidatus Magnetococcus massalia]